MTAAFTEAERQHFLWLRERVVSNGDDVDALTMMGTCFDRGMGVEASALEAMRWYSRAALLGCAEAQFRLASFYFCGNASGASEIFDPSEHIGADGTMHEWCSKEWWPKKALFDDTANIKATMKWYRAAADQGHVLAAHELGCRLMEFPPAHRGAEREESYEAGQREAFRRFEAAAQEDHPGALYRLGLCYQTGAGVRPHAAKARDLFEKAKLLGEPLAAQFNNKALQPNKTRTRARKAIDKGIVRFDDDKPSVNPEAQGTTRARNADIALGQLRCANCSRHERVDLHEKPFKRCGNCKQVLYCSPECQKLHWKTHKPSCVLVVPEPSST